MPTQFNSYPVRFQFQVYDLEDVWIDKTVGQKGHNIFWEIASDSGSEIWQLEVRPGNMKASLMEFSRYLLSTHDSLQVQVFVQVYE